MNNTEKSQKFVRQDLEAGQNTKWSNPPVLLLLMDADNTNPQANIRFCI